MVQIRSWMTIHRIKLKDLDAEFIEGLRAESGDEEAEVTIWLPGKANPMALSEDAFWGIVDKLDWEKEHGEEVIRPAVDSLSRLSVPAIEAFADWLSEKLYLLDGELYAKHAGKNAFQGEEAPFSADEFLYARCYVVGRGKAALFVKKRHCNALDNEYIDRYKRQHGRKPRGNRRCPCSPHHSLPAAGRRCGAGGSEGVGPWRASNQHTPSRQ